MNTWKLIFVLFQPLAVRKLIHLYWLELPFSLEGFANGDGGFIPPTIGERVSISTCHHCSCIWTKIAINTFPIILPTYKDLHFAGVAVVIFRACYCLWLPFRFCQSLCFCLATFPRTAIWSYTRHLLGASRPYVIQNTTTVLIISSDVPPCVRHNSPLVL